tara:strand:+ start:240 stop:461 length:222 start_codon:yes stop_codon:yes gene_type:complete
MSIESTLYLISSIISLTAFIISIIYVYYHSITSYQTTIILLIGIFALSKSIENLEKYVFKSSKKSIKKLQKYV